MPTNSHDYPDVYAHTGINLNALGCVMLDVEPLHVRASLGEEGDKHLFWSPDPARFWIKGPVAEEGGHVTLLYGILKQLWVQGARASSYFNDIDAVMAGWEQPEEVQFGEVLAWPDPTGGPSTTLVADVRITPELLDAHQRLSLLPHVDTYLDYHPHITLAYVDSSFADEARERLDEGLGGIVRTTRLNYGHPA